MTATLGLMSRQLPTRRNVMQEQLYDEAQYVPDQEVTIEHINMTCCVCDSKKNGSHITKHAVGPIQRFAMMDLFKFETF
jgi:hypothetical protein